MDMKRRLETFESQLQVHNRELIQIPIKIGVKIGLGLLAKIGVIIGVKIGVIIGLDLFLTTKTDFNPYFYSYYLKK